MQEPSLLAKTGRDSRLAGEFAALKLERHDAIESCVEGTINGAHASFAGGFQDEVMRDGQPAQRLSG